MIFCASLAVVLQVPPLGTLCTAEQSLGELRNSRIWQTTVMRLRSTGSVDQFYLGGLESRRRQVQAHLVVAAQVSRLRS